MMPDTELRASWLPYASALAFKKHEIANFAGMIMNERLFAFGSRLGCSKRQLRARNCPSGF